MPLYGISDSDRSYYDRILFFRKVGSIFESKIPKNGMTASDPDPFFFWRFGIQGFLRIFFLRSSSVQPQITHLGFFSYIFIIIPQQYSFGTFFKFIMFFNESDWWIKELLLHTLCIFSVCKSNCMIANISVCLS